MLEKDIVSDDEKECKKFFNNPYYKNPGVRYNPETSKKSISQEIFERLTMEFYGEKINHGTSCTILSVLEDVKHKLIQSGYIIETQVKIPSNEYLLRSNSEKIKAYQWFSNGDHPLDNSEEIIDSDGYIFLSEGKIVRRFNHPNISGKSVCKLCSNQLEDHGWLDREDITVCPGDYIIGEKNGFRWTLSEREFKKQYKEI